MDYFDANIYFFDTGVKIILFTKIQTGSRKDRGTNVVQNV
jgi:hypothetical protein